MSILQEKNLRQVEKLHASPHKRMIAAVIMDKADGQSNQLSDEIFNGMIT